MMRLTPVVAQPPQEVFGVRRLVFPGKVLELH